MARQVFLENWQEQLEATIETVAEMTTVYSYSREQEALLGELHQLREMARQVQEVAPAERDAVGSYAIAISVREPLQLPSDLVERLGELFDIYRRFRTRLTWAR
jgi:hypothetical protein